MTELWSIKQGLKLAKEMGFKDLKVETDYLLIVKLIKEENIQSHPFRDIIEDCRYLFVVNRATITHI